MISYSLNVTWPIINADGQTAADNWSNSKRCTWGGFAVKHGEDSGERNCVFHIGGKGCV